MKLYQLLSPDRIMLDIDATDCETVIDKLVGLLVKSGAIEDHELVKKMVLDREAQVGTGIGYGIAIPHADPGPFAEPIVAFGRVVHGIDFHAPDGGEARLIFLLLTPESTPALHVRLLARICRLTKSESLRTQLLEVSDAKQASAIITSAEADYPELNP